MSINTNACNVRNERRAIVSIPMICSAAIIAAAAVTLPSRVVAAVHAPRSAVTTTIAACTHETWPNYSSACLRRDDAEIRQVRVIPLDHVVKN